MLPPNSKILSIGNIEQTSCSLEWEIPDYFSMSQKADIHYWSPVFEFAEATWHLRIFPNGERKNKSIGWISLSLCLEQAKWSEHFINVMFSIRDTDGDEYIGKVLHKQITQQYDTCDWDRVIKRAKLFNEKWKVAPNGNLSISCTLSCDSKKHFASKSAQQISAFRSLGKVNEDFKNLFLNESDCDVTLKVKDRDFKAHKLILGARSPVFSSMFKHDTLERSSGIVNITDCDPDVFKNFLHYLYSGKVDEISSCNILNLYTVADKYGVVDLQTECLNFMEEELSVDTFGDFITLAVRYDKSSQIEIATTFFTKYIKEIILTVKWQSFIVENPIVANKLHIQALKTMPM